MVLPAHFNVSLYNGDLTFQIRADLCPATAGDGYPFMSTYFLAVDGQQLRPFVESLPTTDPDRSVMLGLLSMPGTRPVTCFRIPSEYGGGWIHNLKWKKSAVKALLVQSRKGKMVNDIGHNDNDLCENCESTQCGVGFAIPFLDCYMLEGIFDGKCGNSTFQDDLVF